MNEILDNALNRGAPIDTPIEISIGEFLNQFEIDALIVEYRNCCREIVSKISNIMDVYGGSFILPTCAIISLDENNSKVLRFSGENYLSSIINLLEGVNDQELQGIIDNKKNFARLKEKILSIKTPEELKIKLPRIYDLYLEQIGCNKNFIELDKMLKDKNTPNEIKYKNLAKISNNFTEFYSDFNLKREIEFAYSFTLTAYLERIMKAIENLLMNSEEIINIYYGQTLDIKSFNKEDEDRLNLYLATKFMNEIENPEVMDKQRYLFYLTNYFKENVETKVVRVKIKLDGKKVTPINLYERYKRVLAANPNLLAINFSQDDFKDMTREEAEEFVAAYLTELSANWELIPKEDTTVEKSVRIIAKRQCKELSEEERIKKEERLLNLYVQKKNFYDQTDPYFRIKGKQTFDGYVGYIYSNALVILEKFYENAEKVRIAKNEAVYVIPMKDFYELSQHSKSYLIANRLCRRVIHKGAWQERVLRLINKNDTNATPTEGTRKLILERKVSVKEK